MTKPKLPRDAAGSFKLPATKPGSIQRMCSLRGFMEIYTPHETFKIQTPETIDPGRTNPNAAWVNAKTHDVGSASPFVARTTITASETVSQLGQLDADQRTDVLMRMHAIKETLLQIAAVADQFEQAHAAAAAALEESGFKLDAGGRALVHFPVVPGFDAKVTAFLIGARRCISEICQIPGHFWTLSRTHTQLDYLLKTDLVECLGANSQMLDNLASFVAGTKRVIDMRNGQEHAVSTKGLRLHAHNFDLMPNNQIRHPVWFLAGEEPADIATEMQAVPDFLLRLAEHMLLTCALASAQAWPPLRIERVEQPNPECPIRYAIGFDLSGAIAGRQGDQQAT